MRRGGESRGTSRVVIVLDARGMSGVARVLVGGFIEGLIEKEVESRKVPTEASILYFKTK